MRFILDVYRPGENQDDTSLDTSIGRFRQLRPYMPDEMAERIFEIYSHYDFSVRAGIADLMPVIPFQKKQGNNSLSFSASSSTQQKNWKRPDPRFLDMCRKLNISKQVEVNNAKRSQNLRKQTILNNGTEKRYAYDLKWMYHSVNDQLFDERKNKSTGDEESAKPLTLFSEDPLLIDPFYELSDVECQRLEKSPAGGYIQTTWSEYKIRAGVQLLDFKKKERPDERPNLKNYPFLSQAHGSLHEVLSFSAEAIPGKAMTKYDKILKWKEDDNAWTDELQQREDQTSGSKKPKTPKKSQEIYQMSFEEYQAESKRVLEADITAEHLEEEDEQKRMIAEEKRKAEKAKEDEKIAKYRETEKKLLSQ